MRVVYTAEAIADLDGIFDYIANHSPAISNAFQSSPASPESAQEVSERPGVRVAPLIRYPYKVFYRVSGDTVEILHVHHTVRE